jgi:hypothetical protein
MKLYEVRIAQPDILIYVEAKNVNDAQELGFQKFLDTYPTLEDCYISDVEEATCT